MTMKVGDVINLRQMHADGVCYRWHEATVESISATDDGFVVTLPLGTAIQQTNGGVWHLGFHSRMYFMPDRWYILEEMYGPDGRFHEIYVNINAPFTRSADGKTIEFIDYELDVSMVLGQSAVIVDQDEFAEAIVQYGYSEAHQQRCWQAANEALALAEQWTPKGWP